MSPDPVSLPGSLAGKAQGPHKNVLKSEKQKACLKRTLWVLVNSQGKAVLGRLCPPTYQSLSRLGNFTGQLTQSALIFRESTELSMKAGWKCRPRKAGGAPRILPVMPTRQVGLGI